MRDVHDGDGDSGDDVCDQVVLDVVVEEPVGERQVLVQNFLPSELLAPDLVLEVVESCCPEKKMKLNLLFRS